MFSLHVFGKNKTKNGIIGFSSISPEQYLKQRTVFVLHFSKYKSVFAAQLSCGNSWSRGKVRRVRPGTQKKARWRLRCACFWTLQWFADHRLYWTSTPWPKRLTISWLIRRPLAPLREKKCATSSTGNETRFDAKQHNKSVCLEVKLKVRLFWDRRNVVETKILLLM